MDSLRNVRRTWDRFAEERPHWSVLTTNSEIEREQFYKSGREDVAELLREAETYRLSVEKKKALDFGCGLGRLTYPLCDYFEEVAAVDISRKMIELASFDKSCPKNVKFHLNEGTGLSFLATNSFDFVVSLIVLQHMPKRCIKSYLRELARVLKPNGVIVVQVPSHRRKIETGKPQFWPGKPIRSGDPPLHTLCYRYVSRSIRWVIKRSQLPLLSNEFKYRVECAWKKLTGQQIMQMNTLGKKVVERLLQREQCEVVSAREDGRAGDDYTSLLYFARKKIS